MMKHFNPIILLAVIVFGLAGSYISQQTLLEDAERNWRSQADRDGQWLTSTLLAWLEESYAPMSGLAILVENSEIIEESEFLNAFDALESRAAAFFLDAAALASGPEGAAPLNWTVEVTTDPGGRITSGMRLNQDKDLQTLLTMAYGRSGEIMLGHPIGSDHLNDVFVPVGTHVLASPKHFVVLGLIDLTSLVQGLFELNVPPGMALSVEGRFPEPEGQGDWRAVYAGEPKSSLYSVTTRTVSAGAELAITWYFDSSFLGGPSRKLADTAFYGGSAAVLILAAFLGLLLTQNQRISRSVEQRTEELRESQQVLSNVMENIPQGLAAYDSNARLIAWNTRYKEIFGLDASLLFAGQTVRALIRDFAGRGGYGPDDVEIETDRRLKVLLSREPFDPRSPWNPAGYLMPSQRQRQTAAAFFPTPTSRRLLIANARRNCCARRSIPIRKCSRYMTGTAG